MRAGKLDIGRTGGMGVVELAMALKMGGVDKFAVKLVNCAVGVNGHNKTPAFLLPTSRQRRAGDETCLALSAPGNRGLYVCRCLT